MLNSLAARTLAKAGFEGVTLSVEGDRRQFEEVTAFCPLPTSLYVFGRPLLVVSRGKPLDPDREPAGGSPRPAIHPARESGLWVLRPDEPFDLRGLENDPSGQASGRGPGRFSDPVDEWQHAPGRGKPAFLFNYERSLA